MRIETLVIGTLALTTLGLFVLFNDNSTPVKDLGAHAQFSDFMFKHNKEYDTITERKYRFEIFKENL